MERTLSYTISLACSFITFDTEECVHEVLQAGSMQTLLGKTVRKSPRGRFMQDESERTLSRFLHHVMSSQVEVKSATPKGSGPVIMQRGGRATLGEPPSYHHQIQHSQALRSQSSGGVGHVWPQGGIGGMLPTFGEFPQQGGGRGWQGGGGRGGLTRQQQQQQQQGSTGRGSAGPSGRVAGVEGASPNPRGPTQQQQGQYGGMGAYGEKIRPHPSGSPPRIRPHPSGSSPRNLVEGFDTLSIYKKRFTPLRSSQATRVPMAMACHMALIQA